MFIGTPHAGSDFTKFALTLRYLIRLSLIKKPGLSNLKVLKKNSETLAGIQESFSTLLTTRQRLDDRSVEIHCCIEEKPVSGARPRKTSSIHLLGRMLTSFIQRVVEPASAHFPGYHTYDTIPANHIAMTRFRNRGDVGYDRISKRLKRWVAQAQKNTSAQPACQGRLLHVPTTSSQAPNTNGNGADLSSPWLSVSEFRIFLVSGASSEELMTVIEVKRGNKKSH